MDSDLSEEVKSYIVQHIGSAAELELLIFLHAAPGRDWTATEIGQALRIDPAWIAGCLIELVKRKIVTEATPKKPSEQAYIYAPSDPALTGIISALAHLYETHRVMIITLIYSKPTDPLRNFADAFRLRKDKDHG